MRLQILVTSLIYATISGSGFQVDPLQQCDESGLIPHIGLGMDFVYRCPLRIFRFETLLEQIQGQVFIPQESGVNRPVVYAFDGKGDGSQILQRLVFLRRIPSGVSSNALARIRAGTSPTISSKRTVFPTWEGSSSISIRTSVSCNSSHDATT